MFTAAAKRTAAAAFAALAVLPLTGCISLFGLGGGGGPGDAHTCMARVMYFESNRSSPDGMIAVGTVVMNRVASSQFPNDVCGVVGQRNQFADGALTRSMTEPRSVQLASEMASRVLRGERHRGVGSQAMYFHTAGLTFPYNNMHYVVVAGGNAFYERR